MLRKSNENLISGSFKDPSGEVYKHNNKIFRIVNHSYKDDYNFLFSGGLYKKLEESNLLIPHKEIENTNKTIYKLIKPKMVPFISYPYEWSFSELKDAALATLAIQRISLEYGMSLKDASAYNIQFFNGRPILIDTLSFEIYQKNTPWVAYRQFCMHFLGPLLLMKYADINLNKLMQIFIDGVPLNIVSSLLPFTTWIRPSILTHIHAHAKIQRFAGKMQKKAKEYKISKISLMGIIDNLESTISNLKIKEKKSIWNNYYHDNNYTSTAFTHKKSLVMEFVKRTNPSLVWDLGANTGIFSHNVAKKGILTISTDNDPWVVESNYLYCKKNNLKNCLPLNIDVNNPTPSLGWENMERYSFDQRGPADTVLSLALLHHISIGNNVPFRKQAKWYSKICQNLIIEFIPKEDSQVQRLLSSRNDIFTDYNQASFEKEFSSFFIIAEKIKIRSSKRYLYLMKRK